MAKKTYTGTMLNPNLEKAQVRIYLFDEVKWEIESDMITKDPVIYTGVTSWDIITGGEEAEEIENQGLIDEYHEYLVLHFNTGEMATFRNSHVDMFIR
jgi:hypothetical protein